jgi:alcohol dehydrogenase class IV
MRFEFATAGRIIFGAGTIAEVPGLAAGMGRHALVMVGRSPDRSRAMVAALAGRGLETTVWHVPGEPTVELVASCAEMAAGAGCDVVVAIGGGSVLDAGKAVAALLTNRGDVMDYLEVIGRARPLDHAPAPFIAVPTTAGTGAEVTRNAVLGAPNHRVKVSMRSPLMLPRVAVVDPELTVSVPPDVTATTGLDALTQLIEPFVSPRANPVTDALCCEGMVRVASSLRRAWRNGADLEARTDMCVAALFGGMALANAGLGAVHGFAGPLGGMLEAPHGALCAALLPVVLEANCRALTARAQTDSAADRSLERLGEAARILTGNRHATAADGIEWVRELCRELDIPTLREMGLDPADIPQAVERASQASSMKGNPVALSSAELTEILAAALDGA